MEYHSMKKYFLLTMVILLCVQIGYADIEFSGSACVRPRYDFKIYKTSSDNTIYKCDMYFDYRAKLNIKGTLGSGYFFKGQISHNSPANWSKMGDGSGLPSTFSQGSGQSPSIAFTELCLGYQGEKLAYKLGRFTYAHNTALDIHYYPTKLLDIPFFIFNNNAITGAEFSYKLKETKLRAALSVDQNNLNYQNYIDLEGDSVVYNQNGITATLDASIPWGNITIAPVALYSMGKTMFNPITGGIKAQYKNKGLLLKTEAAFTLSNHYSDEYRYTGFIVRAEARQKIGFGTLRLMYDYSNMNYTKWDGVDKASGLYGKFHYTWLEYTMPLFESDLGCIVARPVWRWYYSDVEADGQIYIRNKIELYFQYTF
jgi:hypothetical protein